MLLTIRESKARNNGNIYHMYLGSGEVHLIHLNSWMHLRRAVSRRRQRTVEAHNLARVHPLPSSVKLAEDRHFESCPIAVHPRGSTSFVPEISWMDEFRAVRPCKHE